MESDQTPKSLRRPTYQELSAEDWKAILQELNKTISELPPVAAEVQRNLPFIVSRTPCAEVT
jgi:hypothetical protein